MGSRPEVTVGSVPTRTRETYVVPPVDIFETDDGIVLLADLPGVERDTLDITVEAGTLGIRGRPTKHEPGEAVRQEFAVNDYYREFSLYDEVDHDKISAELKHGVLTLTLPKSERAKPKKIAVTTA